MGRAVNCPDDISGQYPRVRQEHNVLSQTAYCNWQVYEPLKTKRTKKISFMILVKNQTAVLHCVVALPLFSERKDHANSVYPDQTDPAGAKI